MNHDTHTPTKAWAAFLTGRIAQEREDFPQALAAFNDALSLDPDHPFALVTRGCVLARLHRMDEAVAAFDEIVRRFEQAPDAERRERVIAALNNKAFHLLKHDRVPEALDAYQAIADRFSADPVAALREHAAALRPPSNG